MKAAHAVLVLLTLPIFAGCQGQNVSGPTTPPPAACIDYANFIHWERSIPSLPSSDISVVWPYAYVVGAEGMQILDMSRQGAEELVGRVELNAYWSKLVVDGSYAYMADNFRLRVVDVSDPRTPRIVGDVPVVDSGGTLALAVNAGYAYLGGSVGMSVIDVSTPGEWGTVASVVDDDGARYGVYGVAAAGSYVYTVGGPDLHIIDMSNPRAPEVVGSLTGELHMQGIALAGSYACIASSHALDLVDISTPSAPVKVGTAETRWGYEVAGVKVVGKYVFVARRSMGLDVFDISNVHEPKRVGHTPPMPGAGDSQKWGEGIEVVGAHAYLTTGSPQVEIIDVVTPRDAPSVSTGAQGGQKLAVDGSRAYTLTGWRVNTLDVSNPNAPFQIGTTSIWTSAIDLAVSGSHVYVVGGSGLTVVDVSVPSRATIVSLVHRERGLVAIATSGPYAYVAGRSNLEAIDVSVGNAPVTGDSVSTLGYALDLVADGSRAIVAGDFGIQVVDISAPGSLSVIGNSQPMHARAVVLSGPYAYVAGYDGDWPRSWSGLRVFDVSVPGPPLLIGSLPMPWDAVSVASVGSYAYVLDYTSIQVVDMSRPDNPTLVGSILMDGISNGVASVGSKICVLGDHLTMLPSQCERAAMARN